MLLPALLCHSPDTTHSSGDTAAEIPAFLRSLGALGWLSGSGGDSAGKKGEGEGEGARERVCVREEGAGCTTSSGSAGISCTC